MKRLFEFSLLSILLFCFSGMNARLSCADNGISEGKAVSSEIERESQPHALKRHGLECPAEACSHLREGRELISRGKYSNAAEKLRMAYRELPVLGDYILFSLAQAYAGNGEFGESNRSLEEILRLYPDSLLKKKVRSLEIKNRLAQSDSMAGKEKDNNITSLLRQFVTDYPEDAEMNFLLAETLEKEGEREQAKKIFREIYISAGPFSDLSRKELQPSDITPADMLARASSLIKMMKYNEAETLLKKALSVAGESLRDDALKKLGTIFFNEKRYHEAASEFSGAGDTYNAARSLYRAGELEAFHAAVSQLVSMKDKRAASLLLAFAGKTRRDGNIEETLELYRKIKASYPSHAEGALWGIAWTFYRIGDYEAASKVLAELSTSYPNSRYVYWRAKSSDSLSERGTSSKDAAVLFDQIKGVREDFYSVLADMYSKDGDGHSTGSAWIPINFGAAQIASSRQPEFSMASQPINPVLSPVLKRFAILTAIGMKEEALAEILNVSRTISDPDSLLYLGYLLTESEDYKNAIALMSPLASRLDLQEKKRVDINAILYPSAYWPIVEGVAKTFNLDPFILLSVMREESRFDPYARSSAGALGLMQLMPQTADKLCDKAGATSDIHDVRTNITIGAYYLVSLVKEFGSLPPAIAAYNAGEERVREWLHQGNYRSFDEFIEDIPYDETRNYVKRVLLTYSVYRQKKVENLSSCCGQTAP